MKVFVLSLQLSIILFACALAPPTPVPRPPIEITKCIVASGGKFGGIGIHVEFENQSSQNIAKIVWRGKYGHGWLDFVDVGEFSPGVKVTHELWYERNLRFRLKPAFQNYYVNGLENCSVVEIASADATLWRDSSVSSDATDIPQRPADDAATVPPSISNPSGDPVGIVGCNLTLELGKKSGMGELAVRFRNLSNKTIDRIIFRGFYGTTGFDFTYGGNFSPGILINSKPHSGVIGRLIRWDLPAYDPPVSYQSLDAPDNCAALSVHFSDGTLWQNPDPEATAPPGAAPTDRTVR